MERALFGRQTELAAVSRLLDGMPSGPVALVVGGEPGIGKSALWHEALVQGRSRTYRVLSCVPGESEAKLSFAALGDLLSEVADESFEGLPPPQRSAIESALLRADAGESPPDQRAISSAFLATLVTLAAVGPCLLAIDDAQWLDAPSARVLEFAIRRLNDVLGDVLAAPQVDSTGSLALHAQNARDEVRLAVVTVAL